MTFWQISASLYALLPPLILIYDFAAYKISGSDATISRVALYTSDRYPLFIVCVCGMFGVLMGHLFAPTNDPAEWWEWLNAVMLVGVPFVCVCVEIWETPQPHPGKLGAVWKPLTEMVREFILSHRLLTACVSVTMGTILGARLLAQHPNLNGVSP
jgi:hypothetical protein